MSAPFTAHADVATEKGSRYLQALCGHFDRKVDAVWDPAHGDVDFGFGRCRMEATEHVLRFEIRADDLEGFARAKAVVSDHLERFAVKDGLRLAWVDGPAPTPADVDEESSRARSTGSARR
jgi:hypothetical protein